MVEAEVDALDERVRRDHDVVTGPRPQHGGVVPDPEHHPAPLHASGERLDASDQPELAERRHVHAGSLPALGAVRAQSKD